MDVQTYISFERASACCSRFWRPCATRGRYPPARENESNLSTVSPPGLAATGVTPSDDDVIMGHNILPATGGKAPWFSSPTYEEKEQELPASIRWYGG